MTDGACEAAEAALGVTLPPAYLDLLGVQNGGAVAADFTAFPVGRPTSWAADHVPFDDMMGIGSKGMTILDSPALNLEWGMPAELVLLTGDGHWWIALDYRRSGPDGPPSVVWFDNEVDEDIELAVDFASFLQGLRSDAHYLEPD